MIMNCNGKIEIVFGLSLRSGFYINGFLFNEFCGCCQPILIITVHFISSDFNLDRDLKFLISTN